MCQRRLRGWMCEKRAVQAGQPITQQRTCTGHERGVIRGKMWSIWVISGPTHNTATHLLDHVIHVIVVVVTLGKGLVCLDVRSYRARDSISRRAKGAP